MAAQRAIGRILAEAVAEPECVDDGAFPVGDPAPLAAVLANLEAPEIEPGRTDYMEGGRRALRSAADEIDASLELRRSETARRTRWRYG